MFPFVSGGVEFSKPRCNFPFLPYVDPELFIHMNTPFTHSNQLATNNANAKIPAFESGCDIWAPEVAAAAKLELTKDGPQLTFTCIAAET